MAEGLPQLPQLNLKVKNTFLEANLAALNTDSEDDLTLDLGFHRRQVTDPAPSTGAIIGHKKVNKDVDDSNGVDSTPKVSEEPELEPDLQPNTQGGMARQVTEENWNPWNRREWEPDMEQSCVYSMNACDASRRTSWADVTDDPYDVERKPVEKVAIALSPALAMPQEAVVVTPSVGYPSVQAIAASALLGCTFDQFDQGQLNFAQRSENAKLKSGRRRKKESLIDQAARIAQKEEKNSRRQQTRQNGKTRGETGKPLVPMFCHQCGGACSPEFKFCRFCGAKTIDAP